MGCKKHPGHFLFHSSKFFLFLFNPNKNKTGITGQDGSYLSELLLKKGYTVHGIIRRSSSFNTGRINHLIDWKGEDSHDAAVKLHLHYGDLTDSGNLCRLMNEIKPDEVYNLGAQSHVRVSFDMPEYTANVDGLGVLRLLDAIRMCGLAETCRFYQASTSELYGLVQEVPQSETTPFYPRSPYAVAKQYGFWIVKNYREAYGMHLSNGILFNHESPRRGPTFVTRKITRAVARIHLGLQEQLFLGNMDALRDWGHARDYVHMMWLIVNQEKPDDYVAATGEMRESLKILFFLLLSTSFFVLFGIPQLTPVLVVLLVFSSSRVFADTVREFVEKAFIAVGTEILWRNGPGVDEEGYDAKDTNRVLVKIDPRFFRPTEVEQLLGDPTKAKEKLGWTPTTLFKDLVKEMVAGDLALVKAGDLIN